MLSPLADSEVEHLFSIPVSEIRRKWQVSFGISLVDEMKDLEIIDCYECKATRLRFFLPEAAAASEKVYGELGKFDWYYMDEKWEHRFAQEQIRSNSSVLEIGCGRGQFLLSLQNNRGCAVRGVEFNKEAVRAAQDSGVNVTSDDLRSLAAGAERFDVVCHFQVLEHVANIKAFLNDSIECLRPGGLLIVGVPNMESFLAYQKNPLNLPPHHMSQWYPASLQKLPNFFPVTLKTVGFEPLPSHHVAAFQKVFRQRISDICRGDSLLRRVLYSAIDVSGFRPLRKLFKGQTMVGVFEKL